MYVHNLNTACILTAMGKTKKSKNTQCSLKEPELHKVGKRPARGVRLTSQSRHIIENVRQFFEEEKSVGMCLQRSCVAKWTAAATGVSIRTVLNIRRECVSHDGEFLIPVKRYSTSRIRINPDSFDREVIRRTVHGFCEQKEYPTLSAVLEWRR